MFALGLSIGYILLILRLKWHCCVLFMFAPHLILHFTPRDVGWRQLSGTRMNWEMIFCDMTSRLRFSFSHGVRINVNGSSYILGV
jgi:hypothetical protein